MHTFLTLMRGYWEPVPGLWGLDVGLRVDQASTWALSCSCVQRLWTGLMAPHMPSLSSCAGMHIQVASAHSRS